MKKILINATQKEELRVAIIDGKKLIDLDIDTLSSERKKGNIYKGKIARIEPGLDAVFVDYGEPKHGFLPFREIAPAYYKNNQSGGGKDNATTAKSLRQGQSLLVQVQRETRDNKGAAMTTFISLAGRYLVLMPNSLRPGGVSRRVGEKDRNAMRETIEQLDTGDSKAGIIARTQGVGRNPEALQQDFDNLKKLWDSTVTAAKTRPAPFLVYQESNIAICALRDHFSDDIEKIMIDNEKVFQDARDFVQLVMPDQVEKLNLYQEPVPLFQYYGIEDQIEAAFHRRITLPSGGSLVLDHTEALLSIDINSGKATKAGNIEETALNTNLEAVDEIALQLRLRDLGGLIVIDFIDMESATHRRMVEDRLYKATCTDQARVRFEKISRFGLLEMSRQRLRPSLSESNHITCPRCEGKGVVRNLESSALAALRMLEKEASGENSAYVIAHLPIETASFLLNKKRMKINEIEIRHNVKLVVIPDAHTHTPNIQIQKRIDDEHFRNPARRHKPLTHQHYLAHNEERDISPARAAGNPNHKPGFLSGVFSFFSLKKEKTEDATAKAEKNKRDKKQQQQRQASNANAGRKDNGRSTRRRSGSQRRSGSRRSTYAEASERKDEPGKKSGSNRDDRYRHHASAPERQATPQNKSANAPARRRSSGNDGNRHNEQRDSSSGEPKNKVAPMPSALKETHAEKPAVRDDAQPQVSNGNRKQESYSPPSSSRISHLTQVETKSSPKSLIRNG